MKLHNPVAVHTIRYDVKVYCVIFQILWYFISLYLGTFIKRLKTLEHFCWPLYNTGYGPSFCRYISLVHPGKNLCPTGKHWVSLSIYKIASWPEPQIREIQQLELIQVLMFTNIIVFNEYKEITIDLGDLFVKQLPYYSLWKDTMPN